MCGDNTTKERCVKCYKCSLKVVLNFFSYMVDGEILLHVDQSLVQCLPCLSKLHFNVLYALDFAY